MQLHIFGTQRHTAFVLATWFCIIAQHHVHCEDGDKETATETPMKDNNLADVAQQYLSSLQYYRKLFKQKRVQQLEAIKAIVSMDSNEKRLKMADLVISKMFEMLQASQQHLMQAGISPGDPIPTDEKLRDVYSVILENTAFFGELLLRAPDLTYPFLRSNKERQLSIAWSVGFCKDSGVFEGPDKTLIHLMSQELGLIEKDPNFVNPYKEELKKMMEQDMRSQQEKERQAREMKKKKAKRKRGPRLSTEL